MMLTHRDSHDTPQQCGRPPTVGSEVNPLLAGSTPAGLFSPNPCYLERTDGP